MKKTPLTILSLILILSLLWIIKHDEISEESIPRASNPKQVSKDTVIYTCDSGKTIHAAYHEGEEVKVNPGEMPVPTGSVDVSLNAADPVTLKQTISGSGVRYTNNDESFVFWNKGNEAIVIRNSAMDLDYKNCLSK